MFSFFSTETNSSEDVDYLCSFLSGSQSKNDRNLRALSPRNVAGDFCQQKYEKIATPAWFHFLTPKQIGLLDCLPMSLSDDIDEGSISRCHAVCTGLYLLPLPTSKQLRKAIRYSGTNPVLFLVGLSEFLPQEDEATDGIESTLPFFSLNQRIIMTCVSYFEIPVFIEYLDKIMPLRPEHRSTSTNPSQQSHADTRSTSSSRKHQQNPYFQPVWVTKPRDWLTERLVAEEKSYCKKRMPCLSDLSRTTCWLTHIRPKSLPQIEIKRPAPVSKRPDLCRIVEMCRVQETTAPPVKYFEEVNDAVLEDEDVRFNDVLLAVKEALGQMKRRGMFSAKYSQIIQHPMIKQYFKCYNGQEETKEVKIYLADKAETCAGCVRELYKEHSLEVPVSALPDNTWVLAKRVAHETKQQFYRKLWRESYTAFLHTGHVLGPGYKCTQAIAPIFAAYLPPTNAANHLKAI